MIELYYSPEHDKDIHINFRRSRFFHDVLNLCKMNALDYNGELKHHLISPKKFLDINFYEQLNDIDIVEFVVGDMELIKNNSKVKLQVEYTNRRIKKKLIIVPPLKTNKQGFENYQYDGILDGIRWNRRYFAWDAGTGKSYLMASQITQLFGLNLLEKAFVLAKNEGAVSTKWKILKFSPLFKEEDILVVNTTKDRRYFFTDPKHIDKKIVICAYSTFRAITEEEAKKQKRGFSSRTKKTFFDLDKLNWGIKGKRGLFSDESQELGNPSSKQTKAVTLIEEYFSFRYCYSGSPADESPKTWYSQLNILDKNIIPESYQDWLKTIFKMGKVINGRFNPYIPGDLVKSKYETFKKNILSKYVDFKSKDILDLPKFREHDVYVEMKKKHSDIVNEIINSTMIKIKNENDGLLNKEAFRKNIPVIVSALDNPKILLNDLKIEKYNYPKSLIDRLEKWKLKDHSKFELFDEMVKNSLNNNKKVIIFSSHPQTIDDISDHYKEHNPLKIHGQIKPPKGMSKDDYKFYIAEKFQKDGSIKLGVFSYLLYKTSIDLYEADEVYYFDISGVYQEYDQSRSRVYRNGLQKEVDCHRFVIEKTLNERNLKLINTKGLEKNSLFNTKESFTKEDYQNILTGAIV